MKYEIVDIDDRGEPDAEAVQGVLDDYTARGWTVHTLIRTTDSWHVLFEKGI